MTKIAILAEPANGDGITFRAVAGTRQSQGKTAGEALDALAAQLPDAPTSTLVIIQHRRPDQFFTASQQERLKELMTRWRVARDAGKALPDAEQAELCSLVEAEERAAGQRAAALLAELEQ
jgi:hypothetical protein